MRIATMVTLFGLILAAGCATAKRSAAPTEIPSPTVIVVLPTVPAPASGIVMMIDDFEGAQTAWTVCTDPECTDRSAVNVTLSADHASQGKQALQLNFEKNDQPKAVFYLQQSMDLNAGRAVRFDIFNPGTVDGVGFALTTGPDSIWYESDSVPVAEGKITTLSFDLTAGNYKTAATNWEFRASLVDLDKVTRLSIIIYPKAAGAIYLDNLYLAAAP